MVQQNGMIMMSEEEYKELTNQNNKLMDKEARKIECRKRMVLAMEMLVRAVNDEEIMMAWLMCGVADGDISPASLDTEEVDDYYIKDENYGELMTLFLRTMEAAWRSGGLYDSGILSMDKREYESLRICKEV